MNAIFTRTSVRKFEDRPVEKEKIEKVLQAGFVAPSAGNQQPWEFYVVTKRETIEELSRTSPYAVAAAKAPVVLVIAARKGTVSYKNALEHLPEEIQQFFSGKNIIIIFPDQHGDPMDEMTFAQPQHQEERSAYLAIKEWVNKKLTRTKN